MKIDIYNSTKLKVISFVLILLVLYIHSYYNEAIDTEYASRVQILFGGGGFANVAVPMFFVISGFLFFNGVNNVSVCFHKIGKRFRTLLIPYIIWNIIFVLWYVVIQNLPGIGGYINSDMISFASGGTTSSNLYNFFVAPAAFHLWFLRDLIIIVLLSPIIYYALKFGKWITVVFFILLTPYIQNATTTFNQFGIAYFVLGGAIAMFSNLDLITIKFNIVITFIAIIIYVGHAFLNAIGIHVSFLYYDFISSVAGIICVWKLYDWIVKISTMVNFFSKLRFIFSYSFFIYLFHEPAINIIKKIGLRLLGIQEWSLILLYMINPILMVVASILIARLLQHLFPRVYSILVGGR
jgi:surface polysaccharide O-acyltransferase-like enzyme